MQWWRGHPKGPFPRRCKASNDQHATIEFSPHPEGFPVTGPEIRQRFLDFFAERGHRVVRSSSLVPANDPTLLFTNAGMNQFKDDAIKFAWDLITKDYGIPKDKLYVTVFREDDEAEELWQKVAGVSKSRIFRLDEADNFWQMGDTGPCGPCSEIHYDLGAEASEPGHEHEPFPSDA